MRIVNHTYQKEPVIMKHIRLLVATAAFAAVSQSSFASSLTFGPVNFKLTSIQSNIVDQYSYSTNKTSSSTNLSQTQLYTTTTTSINNNQLLSMLANSLTMTWPAGATLKLDNFGDFDVVDKTNGLIEDVSEVLSISTSTNAVYSGTIVDTETINKNGVSAGETQKYTETVSATLVYDDTFLPTVNGTNTQITVNGIETLHGMTSSSNSGETFKYVVSFIGTGTGSIFNYLVSTNGIIVGGTLTDTELKACRSGILVSLVRCPHRTGFFFSGQSGMT